MYVKGFLICALLLIGSVLVCSQGVEPTLTQVPITSARISSNYYEGADLNATEAYDGNYTNFVHTKEEIGWIQVTLAESKMVSVVKITNRHDGYYTRIIPFVLFFSNVPMVFDHTNEMLKSNSSVTYVEVHPWPLGQAVYELYVPDVQARYVRVALLNTNFFHISELEIYTMKTVRAVSSRVSTVSQVGWHPSYQAYDGRLETIYHSDNEVNSDPWLELRFPLQQVCAIRIWYAPSPYGTSDFSSFYAVFKGSPFQERTASPTVGEDYCAEPGVQCWPTYRFYDLEYYSYRYFYFPSFLADRVRIFQLNGGFMSIAEVRLYSCT